MFVFSIADLLLAVNVESVNKLRPSSGLKNARTTLRKAFAKAPLSTWSQASALQKKVRWPQYNGLHDGVDPDHYSLLFLAVF